MQTKSRKGKYDCKLTDIVTTRIRYCVNGTHTLCIISFCSHASKMFENGNTVECFELLNKLKVTSRANKLQYLVHN